MNRHDEPGDRPGRIGGARKKRIHAAEFTVMPMDRSDPAHYLVGQVHERETSLMRKIVAGGVAALAIVAFAGPALACMGAKQMTLAGDAKTSTQTAEAPSTPKPADQQ
jgi:hypothetical protein